MDKAPANTDINHIGLPDALSSRAVVARRYEATSASPAARVYDVEREGVGQLGWRVMFKKRCDESFGFSSGDHSASAR